MDQIPLHLEVIPVKVLDLQTYGEWWDEEQKKRHCEMAVQLWSSDGRPFLPPTPESKDKTLATLFSEMGLIGKEDLEFQFWRMTLGDFAPLLASTTPQNQLIKTKLITPFSIGPLLRQVAVPVDQADLKHTDLGLSLFLSLLRLVRQLHLKVANEVSEVIKAMLAFLPSELCSPPWVQSFAAFFLHTRVLEGVELALFVSGFHAIFCHLQRICEPDPSLRKTSAQVFENSRPLMWIMLVGLRRMFEQTASPLTSTVIPLFHPNPSVVSSGILQGERLNENLFRTLIEKPVTDGMIFPTVSHALDQCRRVEWTRIHAAMTCTSVRPPLLLQIPGGWGVFVARSKAERQITVMNPLKGQDLDMDLDTLAAKNASLSQNDGLDAFLRQDSRPPKELIVIAVDVSDSMSSAMGPGPGDGVPSQTSSPKRKRDSDDQDDDDNSNPDDAMDEDSNDDDESEQKKNNPTTVWLSSSASINQIWRALKDHWLGQGSEDQEMMGHSSHGVPAERLIQRLVDLQYFSPDTMSAEKIDLHLKNLLRVMIHFTFPHWEAQEIRRWSLNSTCLNSLRYEIDQRIQQSHAGEKVCLPEPRFVTDAQFQTAHEGSCSGCTRVQLEVGHNSFSLWCPSQWTLQHLHLWLRAELNSRGLEQFHHHTDSVYWFFAPATPYHDRVPSCFPCDCQLSLWSIQRTYLIDYSLSLGDNAPCAPRFLHFRLAVGSSAAIAPRTLVVGPYALVGQDSSMLITQISQQIPLRPEDTTCTLLVRHFHELAPLDKSKKKNPLPSLGYGPKEEEEDTLSMTQPPQDSSSSSNWVLRNFFTPSDLIHCLLVNLIHLPRVEELDAIQPNLGSLDRRQIRLLYAQPASFEPFRAPLSSFDQQAMMDVDSTSQRKNTSVSRTTRAEELTRLEVAKLLFQCLVDRAVAYDYPHHYALIRFSNNATKVSPLQPCIEVVRDSLSTLKPNGCTCLLDALDLGLDILRDARKSQGGTASPGTPGRIILLTDGEDTCSKTKNRHIKKRLARMAEREGGPVTVDLVLFQAQDVLDAPANSSIRKPVHWPRLASSHGCVFAPRTPLDATRLGESEIFLSLENRTMTGGQSSKSDFEITIPCSVDEQRYRAQSEAQRLASPLFKPQLSRPFGPSLVLRLLREIRQLVKNPHPHCRVISPRLVSPVSGSGAFDDQMDHDNQGDDFQGNINAVQVLMRAPEGTPYYHAKRGFFTLMILFDDTWPDQAPRCRFVTPLLHVNVSTDGRICHSVLSYNWSPNFTLRQILECIYGLLLVPEASDPVDSQLALQMCSHPEIYQRRVRSAVRKHGMFCPLDVHFSCEPANSVPFPSTTPP